jgi:ligand-binding SRPBCC domain-containing protein
MAVYQRSVTVDAPLAEVRAFHDTADGLVALTPGFLNIRIDETTGPDGEPDPDVLEAGSRVVSSVRPFGIAPRQQWVSDIVAREVGETEAMFRDEMVEGPFDHWVHTHRFVAVDGGTRVEDHVEYAIREHVGGSVIDLLAPVGMAPMFWYRHRQTRKRLAD